MAILFSKIPGTLFGLGPVILLYFLSITEIDTEFSSYFEKFT